MMFPYWSSFPQISSMASLSGKLRSQHQLYLALTFSQLTKDMHGVSDITMMAHT